MNRIVSLRHLRAFTELADAGSFTTAAARLFVTQSSLTATIQQLESAVGLKLFDRTTRRVVMTAEASRFRPTAEKILREFETAIADLQAYAQSQVGHIRIAAAASFIYHFMMPAIGQFRLTYPGITITLRDAGAEQVEQLVVDGEVDFAVASRHKQNDDLDYVPLLVDRYGLVCHPDSPLAKSEAPLRWESLPAEGFVAFTPDTGIGTYLREKVGDLPLFKNPHDQISSTTSLYAVLSKGASYSVVPALAAKLSGFAEFHYRPLERPTLDREICLITRRLRSLTPSSQRLLEVLLAAIDREPLPLGVSRAAARKASGLRTDKRVSRR
jgi:DNA-binding transcriptional LysR family regulator